MKRKTIYLLLGVVVLGIISLWLMLREQGTRIELKDFAVADTASISKIFLADRNKNTILLERTDSHEWLLNGKEKARQDGVNQILSTIRNLSVRMRVAKSAYNGVVKNLATSAVKCEIYTTSSSEPFKVFYVGGSTQDILGTYMMLEKSSVPFVMEIPGFNGYLSPRFSTNLQDWKDKMVFSSSMDDIQSIRIEYSQAPEKSFVIAKDKSGYTVSSLQGKTVSTIDTIGLNSYLSFFQKLGFENWDKEFSSNQRDSLLNSPPFASVSLTSIAGETRTASLYRKQVNKFSIAQMDEKGNPLIYDRDRLYAFINNNGELVVIQYFVFGKILKQLDDFDLSKKKKKS